MNVDRGRRASTAHAYLRPAEGRANLVVRTGALTRRVVVSGNRASGVAYAVGDGEAEAQARREVILAAGAFNSPQLLMLSGIGPAEELRRHGIPVRVDLPGVGENLQDHPLVYMKWACTEPVSISRYARPHRKVMAGIQWGLLGAGPAASNNVETMALMRSDPGKPKPDVMIQYLALILDHDEGVDPDLHGFTFCIGPVTEESRGRVTLRSADPAAPPRILTNFFATDADRALMRRSVRMGREVAGQRAYDRLRGREVEPGPEASTDAELDAYVRARAGTDFHPVGTCRMGSNRDAVVDPELRVHGIEGLRVVDASVMPSITAANTNATTIMIAEKAADLIRGRAPPAPARVPLPGAGNP
jgi:choline dehydrogenase